MSDRYLTRTIGGETVVLDLATETALVTPGVSRRAALRLAAAGAAGAGLAMVQASPAAAVGTSLLSSPYDAWTSVAELEATHPAAGTSGGTAGPFTFGQLPTSTDAYSFSHFDYWIPAENTGIPPIIVPVGTTSAFYNTLQVATTARTVVAPYIAKRGPKLELAPSTNEGFQQSAIQFTVPTTDLAGMAIASGTSVSATATATFTTGTAALYGPAGDRTVLVSGTAGTITFETDGTAFQRAFLGYSNGGSGVAQVSFTVTVG